MTISERHKIDQPTADPISSGTINQMPNDRMTDYQKRAPTHTSNYGRSLYLYIQWRLHGHLLNILDLTPPDEEGDNIAIHSSVQNYYTTHKAIREHFQTDKIDTLQ